MVATVRALGEEFVRLLGRTAGTWWRLLPWLLGFTLIGWAGYYGSVLLGSEVALGQPWLVIGCLALGVLVQLAAIVAALRLVVVRAGVVRAEPGAAGSPLRLLSQTMLPFLAIYAAFGFIDGYARDVLVVISQRYSLFGGSDFIRGLDPTTSTTALVSVAVVVVGLFVLRRVFERAAERTGRVWLGLLAALVEACFALVLLLSVFRLVEQLWLWLSDRQLAAWFEAVVAGLVGWLHLDRFVDAWEFLTTTLWPVVWDLLSQPLAWLALAAVVAGFQFATADDLIDRVRPAGETASPLRGAARLGREVLAGDIDDKVLPLWHAFRHLIRAGWPLVGAFVLCFTVLDWGGELLVDVVVRQFGGQSGRTAVLTAPFLGLVPQVLVLGLQLALLGVAAGRAEELIAADRAVTARPLVQGAVVTLTCVAVALSSLATTSTNEVVVTAALGEPLPVMTTMGSVSEPRAGTRLAGPGGTVPTGLVFVVVGVTVSQQRDGVPVTVELRAGDRRYDPWDGGSALSAAPGFTTQRDVAFEVDPAHLDDLVVRLVPSLAVSRGTTVGEVRLPPLQPAGSASYDALDRESVG